MTLTVLRRHQLGRPLARRAGLRALVAGLLNLAIVTSASAQAWPSRPIRLICPYPTGGVADSATRAVADKLSSGLAVPVVVENKPGAAGVIGIDALAKALPDGYTLGFTAISPLTLNPHLVKVPYQPLSDLMPVARVMSSPVLVLATPAFDGAGFADVIARARAAPGRLTLATSGSGSVGHLMLEQLKAKAGIDIVHVPYKGGSQVISDAVGGQFSLMTSNPSPALDAQIRAGKLRVLAVAAPTRLAGYPGIATLSQLGFAEADMTSTFGIVAPARLPAAIAQRINDLVNRALREGDLAERLLQLDNLPSPAGIDVFRAQIAREYESNGRIITAAGIRGD